MNKYLFSILVHSPSETEAITKLQDENINPADMNIEEIEIGGSFTVVGFYEETGQKYAGHHETETSEEAEAQASKLGVTVCGVFEGDHKAVDQGAIIKT